MASISADHLKCVNATEIFVTEMPPPVEGTDIHVTLRIGANRTQEVDRAIQNFLFAIRRLQNVC
ncbi:hypothetical protein QIO90_gp4 [ssRNA phage Gerhypos.3_5]|jgi:hypothetical protein|uniref:Uncharacterized protein n=2 Tax=Leviviricetes TaxID=2842243 RepID=A0A8S5L2V0_9VIRU|nr:hypothetical protein QIO90_gp4 [ssRNA phage Gerhypos.3_5]QDH91085.1 MAG: hypothetical protein H3Bulk41322_000002 [Leviviridae sp.]DAD51819.1 TPA_asm: hypothetical protein [ssRNA phage Gerhypos.3_5]